MNKLCHMNSVFLSVSRRLASPYYRIVWLFPFLAISTAPCSWADESISPQTASLQPQSHQASISIAANTVNLGDYAQMDVPDGYRFVDAETARNWLDRLNNPVSQGLLGIIGPTSGKWWAVLDFDDIGYVKGVDDNSDFGDILNAVRGRIDKDKAQDVDPSSARIASVDWEIKPKYDATEHSLEWAFWVKGRSGKLANHTMALFGRRGVLHITAVQPLQDSKSQSDSIPLDELAKRITFKEGQGYAEYRDGDKVSGADLKKLVVGEEPKAARQNYVDSHPLTPKVILAYSAVGACVALVSGLLVYAKFKKRKTRPAYTNGHAFNGNGKNGGTLRQNGNGASRKKVFNYYKFYSDMVLECSGHTYGWIKPSNNGNGNGSPRMTEPPSTIAAPVQQTVASANSDLIACQKSLIEEQKNLMREQTRIIEEKAKLIAEYNQLIEKWSNDVENQFSLKLD